MRLTKTLYLFLMIGMFIWGGMIQAAAEPSKKPYPPYPDVWGYDLSELPAMKSGRANVAAYAMEEGDVWFLITDSRKAPHSRKSSPPNLAKPILVKFFKGEKTELSHQEAEQIDKINEGKKVRPNHHSRELMVFKDGSKLSVHYGDKSTFCFIPDFCRNYFVKTDTQSKNTKYSALVATPQVTLHENKNGGKEAGTPIFYQKLSLLTRVIPLKDDTFLVFQDKGNLILRLDKDFKTPFEPVAAVFLSGNYIMRNFFIMDYSVIQGLVSQFVGQPPAYQNVHDALLLHLHNQYSKPSLSEDGAQE